MSAETGVHDSRVFGCCTHLETQLREANERIERLEKVRVVSSMVLAHWFHGNPLPKYLWHEMRNALEAALTPSGGKS